MKNAQTTQPATLTNTRHYILIRGTCTGRILSVFGFLSLFDRNMAVIGFPVGLAGSVRSNPENSVTFALHKLFAGVRPGHVAEVCMFVAADN